MKKTSSRALLTALSVLSLSMGILACTVTSDPGNDGRLGNTEEAFTLPSSSSGKVSSSSGGYYNGFQCSGHPDGYPDSYFYVVTADGRCAIAKPDATLCNDAGVYGWCWGYTVVSYYICPVGKNISCNAYTGACACY